LAPYERIDGSKVNVLVLSPEDLVMEKIETYKDRKAYKDLYDITVLLNNVKEPNKIKKFYLNSPKISQCQMKSFKVILNLIA
jgi:predicted nucleotidyltransferase component of viral defense system